MKERPDPGKTLEEIVGGAKRAAGEFREGGWKHRLEDTFHLSDSLREIALRAQRAAEEIELDSRAFPNLTVGTLLDVLQNMDPNLNVVFQDGTVPQPHLTGYQGYQGHVALNTFNRTHTSLSQLRWNLRKALDTSRLGPNRVKFQIDRECPVWNHGRHWEMGTAVTGVRVEDGQAVLETTRVGPDRE